MSALRTPRRQAVAFFVFVTLIYLFVTRPMEMTTDFVKFEDRVYLTAGPAGLRVLDASSAGKLKLLGAYLTEADALAVAVKGWPEEAPTRTFAYLAVADEGVQVIDVTDPVDLKEAGKASTGNSAVDMAIWEDYLYVATGGGGVHILKLDPTGKVEDLKGSQIKGDITLLKVLKERLYVMDDETLRVYALKGDPTQPRLLGSYDTRETIHDLEAVDGEQSQQVYLAADWDGVQAVQVSKPVTFTASVTISPTIQIETPGQAYGVSRFDEYLFVADYRKGVHLYDLTAPKQPQEVKAYDTWGLTTKIWFDESTSQVYVGDGFSGLRRLDFRLGLNTSLESALPGSDAQGMAYAPPYFFVATGGRGVRVFVQLAGGNLSEVAFYDTSGSAAAVQARPDTWQAFVADGNRFVSLGLADLYHPHIWPNLPASPQIKQMVTLQAGPNDVLQDVRLAPDGKTAYLAAGPGGVWTVDVSKPATMTLLGKESIPGQVLRLGLDGQGRYGLAAAGVDGVSLLDLRNDYFPTRLQTLRLAQDKQLGEALGVAIATLGGRDYGYVAAGDRGLCAVAMVLLPQLEMQPPVCVGASGKAVDVVIDAPHALAYVATDADFLDRYSLNDPARPVWLGQYKPGVPGRRVMLLDGRVVIAAGENGLRLVNPAEAAKVEVYDFAGRVNQFAVGGNYIYTVNGPGKGPESTHLGLTIIDASQRGKEYEVGAFYSTPDSYGGAAYAVDLHPAGNPAYLADGANGLKVLDVSDPSHPRLLTTILPGLDVRHFWVDRDDPRRGYLALGSGDLGLVDLADPNRPGMISSIDACHPNHAVWVQSYRKEYALVGCENKGITSITVVDRARLDWGAPLVEAGPTQRFTLFSKNLLAAAGPKGPQVFNVSRPARPDRFNPIDVGPVQFVFPNEHFFFASHGAGNIDAYYRIGMSDVYTAGQFIVASANPSFETTFLWAAPLAGTEKGPPPLGYQVMAANNGNGLNFYKALRDPRLSQESLYETPGLAVFGEVFNAVASRTSEHLQKWSKWLKGIGMDFLASLVDWFREGVGKRVKTLVEWLGTKWPETGVSPKAEATLRRMFWGDFVFFGLVGILLWAAFFAQFALPVQGGGQRWQAAKRLWGYLLGGHGMMARVQGGQIIRPVDDSVWRGPGVALVDVTSAVVLEKRILERPLLFQVLSKLLLNADPSAKAPYGLAQGWLRSLGQHFNVVPSADCARPPERVAGPGLIFTNGNSYLANPKWDEVVLKAVDLRKQVRTTAEDVFAVTREGIEVKNKVFCLFSASQAADVLLVTYADGIHEAEYLHVVKIKTRLAEGASGKTAVKIEAITDELDQADKDEIHNRVQAWRQDGATALRAFSEQTRQDYARTVRQPFDAPEDRILAAAVAHTDKSGQAKPLEWYELPERVAVKFYLELLAQQPYDGLYRPSDPEDYPLKPLKERFANQVRSQGVLAFQYIERRGSGSGSGGAVLQPGMDLLETSLRAYPITLLTNSKILRDRGIKVIRAGFTELRAVNPGVSQRFIDHWRARWEKHADVTRTAYQIQGMRIRSQARARAQLDMARSLRDILECGEQSREVLALRVFQALESAAADPLTRQLLPAETIAILQLLRQWLITDAGPFAGGSAAPPTSPNPNPAPPAATDSGGSPHYPDHPNAEGAK